MQSQLEKQDSLLEGNQGSGHGAVGTANATNKLSPFNGARSEQEHLLNSRDENANLPQETNGMQVDNADKDKAAKQNAELQ